MVVDKINYLEKKNRALQVDTNVCGNDVEDIANTFLQANLQTQQ